MSILFFSVSQGGVSTPAATALELSNCAKRRQWKLMAIATLDVVLSCDEADDVDKEFDFGTTTDEAVPL